jgi:hypothetical protein
MAGYPANQVTENTQERLPVNESKAQALKPHGSRGELLEQTQVKVNQDAQSSDLSRDA